MNAVKLILLAGVVVSVLLLTQLLSQPLTLPAPHNLKEQARFLKELLEKKYQGVDIAKWHKEDRRHYQVYTDILTRE